MTRTRTRTGRLTAAALLVALAGLLGGCLLAEVIDGDDEGDGGGDLGDNARCELDASCRSGTCNHGFCTPGPCGPDGGSCEDDWECRAIQVTTGIIFKKTETRHVCAIRCDACPDNYSCADGEFCGLDLTLVLPSLEVDVPARAALGEAITLQATATSPLGEAIDRVSWGFADGTRVDGEAVEYVMDERDLDAGGAQLSLTVSAWDVTGRAAEEAVTIAVCLPEGAACTTSFACCSQTCMDGACGAGP